MLLCMDGESRRATLNIGDNSTNSQQPAHHLSAKFTAFIYSNS